MEIAILLYDGITVLDAVGPFEVLSRLPDAHVRFVSREPGLKVTGNGMLKLLAGDSLKSVPAPDILLVPGGPGEVALRSDQTTLDWLIAAHRTSTWTTSVCTGSLLLGAAGLLQGKRATTYWLAIDDLKTFGAVPVKERVVQDGKIMTAAGISAGIDLALTLAARLVGEREAQSIQLSIEYDPAPPFRAGSPSCAPPELVDELRAKRKAQRGQ